MKRFLSWVVLAVCAFVSLFACSIIYSVVMAIINWLLNSRLALVLVVLFGGGGSLTVVIVAISLLSFLTVGASNGVQKSASGTRYKVVGAIIIFLYAGNLILMLFGLVKAASVFATVVADLIFSLYGLLLIIAGKDAAEK